MSLPQNLTFSSPHFEMDTTAPSWFKEVDCFEDILSTILGPVCDFHTTIRDPVCPRSILVAAPEISGPSEILRRQHMFQREATIPAQGTVNMFIVLHDRILLGVDSRSSSPLGTLAGVVKVVLWGSDDKVKYHEVIKATTGMASVVVTGSGDEARIQQLWEKLDQESELTNLDQVVRAVNKHLRLTRIVGTQTCDVLVAGYNIATKKYEVVHYKDRMGEVGRWDRAFSYGAVGSGASHAISKVKDWFTNETYRNFNGEELIRACEGKIFEGLVGSYMDDGACGGPLRLIRLQSDPEPISVADFEALDLFCEYRPNHYHEHSLLFFSREDYMIMNYYILEKFLVLGEWLTMRQGDERYRPMPSCLGRIPGTNIQVFAVKFPGPNNFFESQDTVRGNPFFRRCVIDNTEYGPGGAVRRDHIPVLISRMNFQLLQDTRNNGGSQLPWED